MKSRNPDTEGDPGSLRAEGVEGEHGGSDEAVGGEEEPPRRSRNPEAERSGPRKGRGTGARRRRGARSGGVDPVSKFSASALRRVTVLGDGPSDMVYKLAEQSQRKRGAVVLGTLLVLCAVALVVLSGALVLHLVSGASEEAGGGDAPIVNPPEGHSTLLPELFQGEEKDSEVFQPIAERPEDSEPLTEERVFDGAEELELDDFELTLRDSGVTDTCTALVWGDELAEALSEGSCRSAASGLYKDPDDEYVAQFALFDLEDVEASGTAAQAIDPTDPSTAPGFLLPQDTGIEGLQKGYSQATTQIMGHYLAVYWVARTDGGEPGDDAAMATLNVVAMNASVAVYEEVRDTKQTEE